MDDVPGSPQLQLRPSLWPVISPARHSLAQEAIGSVPRLPGAIKNQKEAKLQTSIVRQNGGGRDRQGPNNGATGGQETRSESGTQGVATDTTEAEG